MLPCSKAEQPRARHHPRETHKSHGERRLAELTIVMVALPPKSRRAPRRAAARSQLCACLTCFAFMCQMLAYYCFHAQQQSSPEMLPPPPPPPPTPPPAPLPPIEYDRAFVANIESDGPPRIPKLLHQSWRDGGFPKTLFNWRWQQGLLELNPGWKLMKWTDQSSRALIAEHYPWFLPTYDAYPSYIQRCDASRYFIVYHHGGVYADLDIECSKPFAPVLGARRAVFSYKQGRNMSRGLVNALFASEARHPLWQVGDCFRLLLIASDCY